MRWKRKLLLAAAGALVSAIAGSEIAKKRFSSGKGSAYYKVLKLLSGIKNEFEPENKASKTEEPEK